MTSASAAELRECQNDENFECLIGSLNSWEELSSGQKDDITRLFSIQRSDLPTSAATSFKFYIRERKSARGNLYKMGDFIFGRLMDKRDCIVEVQKFLSVKIQDRGYNLFCEGDIFLFVTDLNGVKETNFWTGYGHIPSAPAEVNKIIPTESLLRPVIKYSTKRHNIVVDYMRSSRNWRYSVIVPPYLEKNDMVLIQGLRLEDLWYGKIVKINSQRKTVSVYFFVEQSPSSDIFVRESVGRDSRNEVSSESIVSIAQGEWLSEKKWKCGIANDLE